MPAPIHAAALLAAFAGLMLGSFLNVSILRLPAGESILQPRSHCPACLRMIRAQDNIPVLSWLLLRGRCRDCQASISVQYPLVEAATALLFAACVLHTGLQWQTLLDAALAYLALGLAVMDARTLLLPDVCTLGGLALALLLHSLQPGGRTHQLQNVAHAALAAALAALLLLCVRWLYQGLRKREGLGLGDVKLLAMIAAFLGLPQALLTLFLAIVGGAATALVLLARGQSGADGKMPFGSYLAGAAIASIFLGKPILHWYLGWFR
jgi:leader peptidase (prepilin peptidase)/N-methyltransferase